MPIRPELRHFYGREWDNLSDWLKEHRARWKCEKCDAEHGEPHHAFGKKVILTTAHLNHTPGDDRPENLAVWCQWCHLDYDRPMHRAARSVARYRTMHTHDLFED